MLYSTKTSLISSTDHWHENMDNNKMNLPIFLDLKEAFDNVDDTMLIKKLNSFGIADQLGCWLVSYLSNRTQFCALNRNMSKPRKVACVIPQESYLGPLPFTIYASNFKNSLQYFFDTYKCYNYTTYIQTIQGRYHGEQMTMTTPWPVHRKNHTKRNK